MVIIFETPNNIFLKLFCLFSKWKVENNDFNHFVQQFLLNNFVPANGLFILSCVNVWSLVKDMISKPFCCFYWFVLVLHQRLTTWIRRCKYLPTYYSVWYFAWMLLFQNWLVATIYRFVHLNSWARILITIIFVAINVSLQWR